MTSKTTDRFWECFDRLPADVQDRARAKFKVWLSDPFHPSLHFKVIRDDLWSVRVSIEHRALARRYNDLIVWFWIGSHAEYDRLVS